MGWAGSPLYWTADPLETGASVSFDKLMPNVMHPRRRIRLRAGAKFIRAQSRISVAERRARADLVNPVLFYVSSAALSPERLPDCDRRLSGPAGCMHAVVTVGFGVWETSPAYGIRASVINIPTAVMKFMADQAHAG
jgi:hypothetical protein